jgi:hypothetical protein
MNTSEIFISYAWGGENEKIVNELYEVFVSKNYNLIRDKIDLGFKGNIKEFMQRIGVGSAIIVIISDKYLKSENCMFEMLEIKKNGNLWNRIYPIVLFDAKIYDEVERIDYLIYWDNKIEELKAKIKQITNPVGTEKVIEKINQFNDIRRIIDEIMDILRNMNTLTPTMHQQAGFKPIIEALEKSTLTESKNEVKTFTNQNIKTENSKKEDIKDTLRNFIANDKTKEAIKQLQNLNLDEEQKNTVIQFSAKLEKLNKNENLGLLSFSEANQERAKINAGLLQFISDAEIN